MSRKKHIQRLIVKNTRRLEKLKERKAEQGINTPVDVLLRIEDLEAEIETLQEALINLPDVDEIEPEDYDDEPDPDTGRPQRVINTGGGTYIEGGVHTDIGDILFGRTERATGARDLRPEIDDKLIRAADDAADFPSLDAFFEQSDSGMKPWEQRIGPGMRGGGGRPASTLDQPENLSRLGLELDETALMEVIDPQMDLTQLPMVDRHTAPDSDLSLEAESNAEAWPQFVAEQLYDTRRVTLEQFQLFEWFPLTPGKFHTPRAQMERQQALEFLETRDNGQIYFNPLGKATMMRGGIGAVRLRPRQIAGEPHYFMTASSTGVCHEGFPVLIPRRFYGPLKARILDEGAAPVTLSGEMRYIPNDALTFFGRNRDIPLLYLHVDQLRQLPAPRAGVTTYYISAAISFIGRFEGREGRHAAYATFDPARSDSLTRAGEWLEQFYVSGEYKGVIITDFDEARPRFPQAVFGLPNLMAGKLNQAQAQAFLQEQGLDRQANQPFFVVYNEINTQGGAYIEGNVVATG